MMNADLIGKLICGALTIPCMAVMIYLAKKDGIFEAITGITLPARFYNWMKGGRFWGELNQEAVYGKDDNKLVGAPDDSQGDYPKEPMNDSDSNDVRIEKIETTIDYVQMIIPMVYLMGFCSLLILTLSFVADPYSERHGCWWSPSFFDEVRYFVYDHKIFMGFVTSALFSVGVGLQAYTNYLRSELASLFNISLEKKRALQEEQDAIKESLRDYTKEFVDDLTAVFKKHNVVMEVNDEYDGHDSLCGRSVEIKSRNADEEQRKIIYIDDIEELSNDVNAYQWGDDK